MVDYNNFKRSAIRAQDEIVTCPYDPSHQVFKSRLQYHIVNCEKQNIQMDLETCPFNATHRIPKLEMQMHICKCPDKGTMEIHKFQLKNEGQANRNREFIHPELPPSDENWDEEDYQSYDPEKHIKNKCVIRNIHGRTKSERKQFRLEERRRLNQLSKNSEPEVSCLGYNCPQPPNSLPEGITNPEFEPKLGMGRGVLPFSADRNPGKSQSVEKVNPCENL